MRICAPHFSIYILVYHTIHTILYGKFGSAWLCLYHAAARTRVQDKSCACVGTAWAALCMHMRPCKNGKCRELIGRAQTVCSAVSSGTASVGIGMYDCMRPCRPAGAKWRDRKMCV